MKDYKNSYKNILDYKLLTPFEQTYIFYDDGLVLLEKIVSLIIK